MAIELLESPPYWTADLPGIGGRIKQDPQDFEVEEVPAYEPCGSGDFLFLWIEKLSMGAEYFVRQIARRLDIPVGEVGTAGLKDRHAIARQWVSVPASCAERLKDLESVDLRVLQVSRHGNKLRPGHLRGNRFRVLVREVEAAAGERLAPLLQRIGRNGLANFYGAQRFGKDGETVHLGLALLRGENPPGRRPSPFLRKLALSAVQSVLFNRYLSLRLNDGLLRRVLAGDVMAKWPFGGMFVAEDVVREQARFDSREIVSAGPMFGRKTFAAAGEAAAREAAGLSAAGLTLATFSGFGKLLQGTRRHNLIYVDDLTAVMEPEGVRLTFTLPAGSYATVLLGEFMKTPAQTEDEPG